MSHIPFPSINQFKQIVKQVRDNAKFHATALPTIKFRGTVKLHGTNAAVCMTTDGNLYAQSRERVLDLVQDNAGFCAFTVQYKEYFQELMATIKRLHPTKTGTIQVYGEWCGGTIQKSVGLNKLPKMFIVFAIRISDNAESQNWFTKETICDAMQDTRIDPVKSIFDFPSWELDIPFTDPESIQNQLVDITNAVEACCPVAAQLLPDCTDELIGEGVVWTAVSTDNPLINIAGVQFKVKGERHSVSKVRTLAEVDEVKLASVTEFVEMVATDNRLAQGVEVLAQRGVECTPANTSQFIKWVMHDVLKEESGAMVNSGLCTKDITGPICNRARQFWLSQLV